MTREQINQQIQDLITKNDRVLLTWATGVGKSKAAIDMINLCRQGKKHFTVLLLVNETAHKSNWNEEFKRWGKPDCDIVMECYASMVNYRDTEWDMLIADESHHLGSENRLALLGTMRIGKMVCLSATMSKDLISNLTYTVGRIAEHSVSLQDAIDYGMLPEPEISIIHLKLDKRNASEEIVESWGKEAYRSVVHCRFQERFKYMNRNSFPNLELHIQCTPLEKYSYITESLEYWKKRYMTTKLQFSKNKWLHLGSDRKRFLGECKTQAARDLIARAPKDWRYLCFCTSIAQAEALGSASAIHSKKGTKKANQKMIDDFNSGKTSSLYAVGMLQEGMNLKDLDWGMIIQLDGIDRGWIQKTGRMMRSSNPKVFILCYDDTKDCEYLEKVLEGMDHKYIKHYSL